MSDHTYDDTPFCLCSQCERAWDCQRRVDDWASGWRWGALSIGGLVGLVLGLVIVCLVVGEQYDASGVRLHKERVTFLVQYDPDMKGHPAAHTKSGRVMSREIRDKEEYSNFVEKIKAEFAFKRAEKK